MLHSFSSALSVCVCASANVWVSLFLQFDFLNSNINLSDENIGIEDNDDDEEEENEDDEGAKQAKKYTMMENGAHKVSECVKKYGKLNNRNHMIVYRSQNENEKRENKYMGNENSACQPASLPACYGRTSQREEHAKKKNEKFVFCGKSQYNGNLEELRRARKTYKNMKRSKENKWCIQRHEGKAAVADAMTRNGRQKKSITRTAESCVFAVCMCVWLVVPSQGLLGLGTGDWQKA